MTPPWNLDTSQTLQREWCRGMKQREDKVKCQSGIKMRCCEIIVCPHSEKSECRQPRNCIKNYQPAFEQREREHPKIHNRSEEHTSELQSPCNLVCRLLLEKKKT